MPIEPALERKLTKIERLLEELLGEKKKKVWIKPGEVVKLTGWDKNLMRRMRENGVVSFKKDENGWWYDLNSIPPQFIKVQ